MSKFSIQQAVDRLEFDFKPYVEASGVIPEPSNDAIDAFRSKLAELVPVTTDPKGNTVLDVEVLAAKVNDLPEGGALEDDLYGAVVEFCGGVFTVDDLRKLPYRGQRAFVGWLAGTFFRPEA